MFSFFLSTQSTAVRWFYQLISTATVIVRVVGAVVDVVVFGFLAILMRRDMIVWFGVMVSCVVEVVVSEVVMLCRLVQELQIREEERRFCLQQSNTILLIVKQTLSVALSNLNIILSMQKRGYQKYCHCWNSTMVTLFRGCVQISE